MSYHINDDHTQRISAASPEAWIDETDLLFRSTLQQEHAAPAYDRIWEQLRQRIELHQRQEHESMSRALAQQTAEIGWRLRCHWHTIEADLALGLSPLR